MKKLYAAYGSNLNADEIPLPYGKAVRHGND